MGVLGTGWLESSAWLPQTPQYSLAYTAAWALFWVQVLSPQDQSGTLIPSPWRISVGWKGELSH